MLFTVLLCFAFPVVWALYAVIARRELAKYIPMFLLFSLLSVVAASVIQALTQPFFSEFVVFSSGMPALVLHSFVQAGLIEELFKALFFFFALRRVFFDSRELYGISESVAFYFAILSGSLFASFETLAGIFYLPGAAVTRMFTTHILHPVALLISASASFFGKRHIAGYILPCIAAIVVHGFYNFTAGTGTLFAVVVYTAAVLVLAAVLWALIFSRVYPSSGKSFSAKGNLPPENEPQKPEKSENQ